MVIIPHGINFTPFTLILINRLLHDGLQVPKFEAVVPSFLVLPACPVLERTE